MVREYDSRAARVAWIFFISAESFVKMLGLEEDDDVDNDDAEFGILEWDDTLFIGSLSCSRHFAFGNLRSNFASRSFLAASSSSVSSLVNLLVSGESV